MDFQQSFYFFVVVLVYWGSEDGLQKIGLLVVFVLCTECADVKFWMPFWPYKGKEKEFCFQQFFQKYIFSIAGIGETDGNVLTWLHVYVEHSSLTSSCSVD